MTYQITANCINCDRCQTVCPTGAVQTSSQGLYIDASRCNDCQGYYGTPQCAAICPTNQGCLQKIETTSDYWENWFLRYERQLQKLRRKNNYWETWFANYSQRLSTLIS